MTTLLYFPLYNIIYFLWILIPNSPFTNICNSTFTSVFCILLTLLTFNVFYFLYIFVFSRILFELKTLLKRIMLFLLWWILLEVVTCLIELWRKEGMKNSMCCVAISTIDLWSADNWRLIVVTVSNYHVHMNDIKVVFCNDETTLLFYFILFHLF